MALNENDVDKIAHLARLNISDNDRTDVVNRLNQILSMVDELQSAATDDIEPLAHPLETTQVLRADTVTETNQREQYQNIAPATEDGLYLVPQVVE